MPGSGNFTFTYPTESEYRFIVADLVNVTWIVDAPIISLYESCGEHDDILQDQTPNNASYIWTATRRNYVESGCSFTLQPFTAERESYGNNITSVTFGVSKRYTSDPAPAAYNFVNVTESETDTAIPSPTTSATPETASPADTNKSASNSHGLSAAARIGVGVGVSLGTLLLLAIGLGIFLYRRRRQRSRQKEIREVTIGSGGTWQGDGCPPLPALGSTHVYKDPHTRLSQAETIATTAPSQFSSDHHSHGRAQGVEGPATGGTGRPLSELMSAERAELG
ncbi:hypothetical protein BDV10DRAFT_30344 [Aspergillus recurvatus]